MSKKQGDLIQMDNIVSIEEQSKPPQLYHNNRFMAATVSAGLAPGKSINDGIEAMEKIKTKILDDTFTTDLGGNLEILLRVVLILHLHLGWLYY
jgi:HAE1 family hydrophobic/amphiphilic exporter-1/multidrug efflux pump